jgi:hypothetical protein
MAGFTSQLAICAPGELNIKEANSHYKCCLVEGPYINQLNRAHWTELVVTGSPGELGACEGSSVRFPVNWTQSETSSLKFEFELNQKRVKVRTSSIFFLVQLLPWHSTARAIYRVDSIQTDQLWLTVTRWFQRVSSLALVCVIRRPNGCLVLLRVAYLYD